MQRAKIILTAAAALALAACGGTDDLGAGSEPAPTPTADEATSEAEESSEEAQATEEPEETAEPGEGDDGTPDAEQVEDWQVALSVDAEPFVAAEGLTLEVQDAQINDVPNAPANVQADAELVFTEGDEPSPVIGVQILVTNSTEQDVEWFPGQASIVVGGTTLEASFFGDAGPTQGFLAGTEAQLELLYVTPIGTDVEAISTAEVRMVGGAPLDPESFSDIGEEIDLTFSWQPE